MKRMLHLPDVNVWVALTFDSHPNHPAAKLWFDAVEVDPVPTPKEVAQWMASRLEEEQLLQVDAIAAIEKLFGSEFVYLSDVGEKSIDRRVLSSFRKLTEDDVVWVTHHGGGYWSGAYWRKRGPGDSSGRTQYEY